MATILGTARRNPTRPVNDGKLPVGTKPRPPFFLMVHPRQWDYDEAAGDWLPILTQHRMDPGALSITERMDPSTAIAERTRNGWACIDPEALDPSKMDGHESYVLDVPHAAGRFYSVPFWVRPEVKAGGRVIDRVDLDKRRAFQRAVVEEGVVPPLDPDYKDLLLQEARSTLSRKRQRAAMAQPGSPAHKDLAAFEARFAAMEASNGPQPGGTAPKRGRKGAAA
jgi:hypothetical protein